ncbi:hypothetical protein J4443_04600 [Candidatus Woesearchaeota archaeon]|nr:hypothetical protein [Candidatus Woesearchaeota archaeon]
MERINLIVGIFEWINFLITVYLLYRLIFKTPLICINFIETQIALLALIVLLIGRIIKEVYR